MSKKYIEANRLMWNKTAAVHAESYVNDLLSRISATDFTTFDVVEQRLFAQLGLASKSVAQLCCNNGRELIAVKKAGAGRCVGFDISDEFIKQARHLVIASGVEVEFIQRDVYDIGDEFNQQFDLVYITIGALGWLPVLKPFFALIARILKPKGQLFIYEMHPILNMFDAKKGLQIDDSYFRTEPFVDESEPDYMNPDVIVDGVSYWFPHTLADVIGNCLQHGLSLTHFAEYDHDISMVYAKFAEFDKKPPLSYSLIAKKTAR